MILKEEVKHIAKLARLGLQDKEIEKYQKELSSVLDYINLLKKADTSSPLKKFHFSSLQNILREDKAKEQEPKTISKIMKAVPNKEKGYIKVKAVLR